MQKLEKKKELNIIILVIGGTGYLGRALIPKLFGAFGASRVRILSRCEHRQIEAQAFFNDPRIDFCLGDVRDSERVWLAAKGCSMIFNLAAVKSVDKVEYDPEEAVKTNILGAQNVVHAALRHGVEKCIFTSTDKAVEPVNVYGTTKLAAERIFVTSNAYSGLNGPKFAAVRYGNVFGSAGSVIPKWLELIKRGEPLKITAPNMTRFWISVNDAADFVIMGAKEMFRGEVFIPKMKACQMSELLDAVCSVKGYDARAQRIGRRPGEKLHEKLFGHDEIEMMTQTKDYFIRWPLNPNFQCERYGDVVETELTSANAERFTMDELKRMVEGV